MKSKQLKVPLRILLADDDVDDYFFFKKALEEIPISTELKTVENGEKLMAYLIRNSEKLPDILFLDLNMPCKNGSECLSEIKSNEKLKQLFVVIYSTSLPGAMADRLYENGANYYLRKADLDKLEKNLMHALTLFLEKRPARPARSEFIIDMVNA